MLLQFLSQYLHFISKKYDHFQNFMFLLNSLFIYLLLNPKILCSFEVFSLAL